MVRLVAGFALSLVMVTSVFAQDPCAIPANFNPYTDAYPAECKGEAFVPYQVAQGKFDPAAFIFTGGVVNSETLAYLDIVNSSTYAQRVNVEYQTGTRIVLRSYVLPPKASRSLDIGVEEFPGQALSFSVTVTFERLGAATLTMRPAAAPWSSAITPTPRIKDLPAVQQ